MLVHGSSLALTFTLFQHHAFFIEAFIEKALKVEQKCQKSKKTWKGMTEESESGLKQMMNVSREKAYNCQEEP